MKREIEAQNQIDSPHVMVILDHDADADWFAMPLAVGNLEDLATNGTVRSHDFAKIEEIVKQVGLGLEAAHLTERLHRDVKPENILYVEDDQNSGRWVVADWGLVKRPPGQTTALLTQQGGDRLGTLGYAAPELFNFATKATVSADVYSLGRVALRLLSGMHPSEADAPDGPWGIWISACTQQEASRRPKSIADAIALLERLLHPPAGAHANVRDRLAAEGQDVSDETWGLIVENADSRAVYRSVVKSSLRAARSFGSNHPEMAYDLCDHWLDKISEDFIGGGSWNRYDAGLIWILHALKGIFSAAHYLQGEALAEKFFRIENEYNQYVTQKPVIEWLSTLSAPTDAFVLNALRAADVTTWYAGDRVPMKSEILEEELDLWR